MKRRADSSSSSEDPIEEEEKSEASCSETDQDWLWEKLVILCYNQEEKPLDMLKGYIRLHIDSESDRLFKDIMSDVMDAELRDIPRQEAIEYALKMNEDSILACVAECEESNDDDDDSSDAEEEDSFWCRMAEMGGGWDCQWFTGEPCHCERCDGVSVMDTIRVIIKLFLAMQEDDLMQRIEADIEDTSEEMTLIFGTNRTVEKYGKNILAKFGDARKTLDACAWNRTVFF